MLTFKPVHLLDQNAPIQLPDSAIIPAKLRVPSEEFVQLFLTTNINWAYCKWWNSVNRNFCFYCHVRLTDETRTKDHIIPLSLLRKHMHRDLRASFNQMNTVPCCKACNEKKGSDLPG